MEMLSSPSSRPSSRTCDGNEECHPLGRCVDCVIDDVDNNGNDRDYKMRTKEFSDGRQVPSKKRSYHVTVSSTVVNAEHGQEKGCPASARYKFFTPACTNSRV